MDKDVFVQNVESLCKQRKERITNICETIGLGRSFMSDIKRGQTPSVAKVQQLAAYLGVTVSDLLGETTPVFNSDTKEKTAAPSGSGQLEEFSRLFDGLSPQQQEAVLAVMRGMKQDE